MPDIKRDILDHIEAVILLPIAILFVVYAVAVVIIGSILIGDVPKSWIRKPDPDIKKLIEEANDAYKGPRFLELPDPWVEDGIMWCKNGHRSTRTLRRSEGPHRDVCLACFEPVWLGPKELPGVVPK
jgi:hypothetical protein